VSILMIRNGAATLSSTVNLSMVLTSLKAAAGPLSGASYQRLVKTARPTMVAAGWYGPQRQRFVRARS
jgi:hypothetical protein